MSPLVITCLIVGGLVLLMMIAYFNQMVEANKLEKARLKADLTDRIRRCNEVSNALPGQLMTAPLKLLLCRLQLDLCERLLQVEKKSTAVQQRLDELRKDMAQGESIAVKNPPQQIASEAKAKEVRFLLENLHAQLNRAVQENLLSASDAQHWAKDLQQMLVQVHIELFSTLGRQAMQRGQAAQARLAFERGVQYLRKQADQARYQQQLQKLESQLEQANALLLNQEQAPTETEQPSELDEGMKGLEEDGWKKKQIYD